MADIDIADIVDIEVGPPKDLKNYFIQLWVSICNKTATYSFDRLTIPKTAARKIYMRAYPKAKV